MQLPTLTGFKAQFDRMSTWKGINRNALIDDNEFATTTNLSTKNFPLISPRASRDITNTLSGVGYSLFSTQSYLCWVDGTNFVYNGSTKGTVSASTKSMVDYNGKILIFPDKKYYDYVNNVYGNIGSGTYPASGSCPDIDYATVWNNRVWAVKGDNVYASALGEYNDWTTFSTPSLATDAYAVSTNTGGSFTGITTYNNHVVLFKKDLVYELYGDVPSNFQLQDVSETGCIDNRSISEVDSTLFFLGRKGIYIYTGGKPRLISENLNETYSTGVAGNDNRRFYISLYNGSSYNLYVYDTWHNIWLREDSSNVVGFTYLQGDIYALVNDNKIYKYNSGSNMVSWEFESKIFTENVFERKKINQVDIRADVENGSTMSFYIKYDNSDYQLVKSVDVNDLTTIRMPIKVRRCNHFQIKVTGTGEAVIHEMQFKYYGGSNYQRE